MREKHKHNFPATASTLRDPARHGACVVAFIFGASGCSSGENHHAAAAGKHCVSIPAARK